MSLENRDVRPFADLHEVNSWLSEHLKLHVITRNASGTAGETLVLDAGSTLRLDPQTMVSCDLVFRIDPEQPAGDVYRAAEQLAKDLGGKANELFSVVVLGSSSFLRFSEEILRFPLGDLEKCREGLALTDPALPRPRSLKLPHNGYQIDVIVLLNRALKPRPGFPHRLGTWLARTRFTIGSPTAGLGFTPLSLTDDLRREFKLSPQTVTYCRENPVQPDLLSAVDLDDYVQYYVDEEILTRLSSNPRHPQSALVQTQVFLGAIEFLVTKFSALDQRDELELADIDAGLIGKVLRIVSSESSDELSKWFGTLKTKPELFVARVQSQCDYRRRLNEALVGMGEH